LHLDGTKKKREYFKIFKEAIVQTPSLMSLYFEKDFILYNFASKISYVIVLTQKKEEGYEIPIYFMSFGLQDT
jgi:hypothetical protein